MAFDVDGIAGHAFDVDLAQCDLRVTPSGTTHQTVDAIAGGAGDLVLASNASFFDQSGKTMGRVVDAGRVLIQTRQAKWGALIVEGGSARIEMGETLPADKAGGDVVVQGVPRLVVAGEVPKLKPGQAATRTAVCAEGARLTLVVTTTEAEATAFARLLARARDKGGLGCRDALNLDGGPSTQLHARLPKLKLDVKGGWGVPNALVVLPRSSTPPPTTPTTPATPAAPPTTTPTPTTP